MLYVIVYLYCSFFVYIFHLSLLVFFPNSSCGWFFFVEFSVIMHRQYSLYLLSSYQRRILLVKNRSVINILSVTYL